jgi:NAD(P)-dependent dehydrogenase (short-subunit alcohol dehydrogenase family)
MEEPFVMTPESLGGLSCVVTGAAQGIGYATACALARQQAAVAILDLDLTRAQNAADRIATSTGAPTMAVACDVSVETSVTAAMEAVAARLGDLHVLVNNAGIMTPHLAPATTMPVDDFDRMLAVHVRGSFLCSRAAVPFMERARFGRIVNISSVLGLMGLPFRIGYSAAKTAINGLTRSLAVEVARKGITVNAVAPGYILTEALETRLQEGKLDYATYAERAPLGRWGLPEEVARMIVFLALPGSGFITGAIIPVDGGITIRGDPGEDIGLRPESMEGVQHLFGVLE